MVAMSPLVRFVSPVVFCVWAAGVNLHALVLAKCVWPATWLKLDRMIWPVAIVQRFSTCVSSSLALVGIRGFVLKVATVGARYCYSMWGCANSKASEAVDPQLLFSSSR